MAGLPNKTAYSPLGLWLFSYHKNSGKGRITQLEKQRDWWKDKAINGVRYDD